MQSRASDMWNEYQAKKIRSDNLSTSVDLLGLQSAAAAATSKIGEYNGRIAKWKGDLAESQTKAREFEAEVDRAEHRASRYDLGEALLQIAVVLCSVTLFTRNRTYFFLGLALGIAGLLTAATGLMVH